MKILHVLALGGMLVATPTWAASSVDAGKLGHMRGVLDTCTRVNPQQASQYLLQMKAMIGDATKQMVDEAAQTDEYQQAYQSVTDELHDMSADEMSKNCSLYLAEPG